MLNGNKHHNTYLQRAWNKYGAQAFTFEVIEECPIEKLAEREQYWHDLFSVSNGTYNVGSIVASPFKGKTHTEESKRKIKEARKRQVFPEGTANRISNTLRGTAYIFKSPQGETVEVDNLSQFCKAQNLQLGCMSLLAHGKRKQHKGWTAVKPSI